VATIFDSRTFYTSPVSTVVAEVIESSTRHIMAEVRPDAHAPEFGGWVEVSYEDGSVAYGVVAHVEVGSVEPGRRAVALGMSRDELRQEMPQVLALVRTTFRAQILAYRDTHGTLRQTLPPRPAALHDGVRRCTEEAVCALSAPYDYLRPLVRQADAGLPTDDLIAALLRQTFRSHGSGAEGRRAVVEAGKALARLLDDDHERLQSILRRAV
jgi:hypothetical protein